MSLFDKIVVGALIVGAVGVWLPWQFAKGMSDSYK